MKSRNPKLKIFDAFSDFEKIIESWIENEDTIVFTNGCFDILHKGHVEYLYASSEKGDRLIIGLNTDKSVQKLKGISRPVNDQYARALILASLASVDAVIFFEEETPLSLIKAINPNVIVKGSDYSASDMIGGDYIISKGGNVITIPVTEGYSSSSILEKIKSLKDET